MQKQSCRIKENIHAPKKAFQHEPNVDVISLKALFSISQTSLCRLLGFCSRYGIECDGKRNPWCPLEEKIENNTLPPFIFKQLKQQQVMRILLKLNEKLFRTKLPLKFFKGNPIICPFFRINMEECEFLVCPYNSCRVSNTNCLLSVEKELSLAEIAIAKDVPKNVMLRIIYSYEADWNLFEDLLEQGNKKIATCKVCGQFKKICYHDKYSCLRRQKLLSVVRNSNIIPKRFFKYPIILILLVTKKVFGEYCYYIFPETVWKSYTYQLNTLTGD